MPSGRKEIARYNTKEEGETVESPFLQCFSIYTDLNVFKESVGDALRGSSSIH